MKLLKLRIMNLNSFRSEIELDFESKPLNGTSLIAITGPTGAGKTTLLDALCVALYNKTPRLSGKGNKNPGNLLSQGKIDGHAEVLFEAAGNRYLAEWRVKRSSKGVLKPAEVTLYDENTGDLISDRLSSRGDSHDASEMSVSKVVESILGLDFDAFNRSVMLAQGDFAAFLKAEPEKRRAILEATTGIAVYDRLKQMLDEKVNDTERTYNQLEGAIDAIPVVTDDELKRAREDLEEQKVKTQSLQEKRDKISEERKNEEERSRLFDQLKNAEIRQGQLLNQRKEIDLQQSELELAHLAAQLVPKQAKFRDVKNELETIQEESEKANDSLEFAQEEYGKAQRTFAEIDEAHPNILLDRDARMKVYNAARDEETRAKSLLETVKERTDELETIEKCIEDLSKTAVFQDKGKTALEKDIEEDNSFLQESTLPENSNECRIQAHEILQKRNGKSEFRNEKFKTGKQLQSKITELMAELAESEEERQKRIEQKQVADVTLMRAESELKGQKDKGVVDSWESEKHQAEALQSIASEFEESQRRLSEERSDLDMVNDALISVEDELVKLSQKMAVQTEVVGRMEEKVEGCTSEKDLARIIHHTTELRSQLHVGQPCPVCGATEHPWREKSTEEVEEQFRVASSNLSKAEKELQAEKKKLQNLDQGKIRGEATKSNMKKQISESRTKIASLNKKIDLMQVKWKKTYPQNDISLKWTQQKIETADESIRKFHKVQGALKDQERFAERLNDQEKEIQRVRDELDGDESEEEKISTEAKKLNDEIEALDADFWKLLPDDFRGEDQGEALNLFEARIEKVRTVKEELIERQNRLNLLKLEIEQNVKDLNAKREREASVVAEIQRYRSDSEQLSKSARDKTGGLTAEDAIGKLEMEVAEKTALREKSLKMLGEKENTLIQVQTKADSLASQHVTCVEKFSKAKRIYLEALENAGLESPEAHERALRDEAWIKGCEEKISVYKQKWRTNEEEIEKLRPIFADSPFVPELLHDLQAAEQQIDEQIATSNEETGRLQMTIENLGENLRLRKAQEDALEKALQERNRWGNLQNCIPSNSLRDFALERMFDAIILFANRQLADLTKRYELRAEGIDNMVVIDQWNGNEERPVETLSGGEAFLTSLSLALALSEMSRGRAQLNSLYLDEGFGTLDSQTLEIAISALEGLRLAGRTVVVISHIDELTRRIPVRIAVDKMGSGSSRVRIRG